MPDDLAQSIFEVLVREQSGMLMTYVRSAVAGHALAEDIFQETMIVAWRKFRDFDRTRPLGPWLRGIARKLILAHFRTSEREMLLCDTEVLEHLEWRVAQLQSQPGDTWDEKIVELRACLELLAAEHRDLVEMHYGEGASTKSIASRVGLARETVKKRLQRVRAALALCLRRKEVFTAEEVTS